MFLTEHRQTLRVSLSLFLRFTIVTNEREKWAVKIIKETMVTPKQLQLIHAGLHRFSHLGQLQGQHSLMYDQYFQRPFWHGLSVLIRAYVHPLII